MPDGGAERPGITDCVNCRRRVLPYPDGTCPACRLSALVPDGKAAAPPPPPPPPPAPPEQPAPAEKPAAGCAWRYRWFLAGHMAGMLLVVMSINAILVKSKLALELVAPPNDPTIMLPLPVRLGLSLSRLLENHVIFCLLGALIFLALDERVLRRFNRRERDRLAWRWGMLVLLALAVMAVFCSIAPWSLVLGLEGMVAGTGPAPESGLGLGLLFLALVGGGLYCLLLCSVLVRAGYADRPVDRYSGWALFLGLLWFLPLPFLLGKETTEHAGFFAAEPYCRVLAGLAGLVFVGLALKHRRADRFLAWRTLFIGGGLAAMHILLGLSPVWFAWQLRPADAEELAYRSPEHGFHLVLPPAIWQEIQPGDPIITASFFSSQPPVRVNVLAENISIFQYFERKFQLFQMHQSDHLGENPPEVVNRRVEAGEICDVSLGLFPAARGGGTVFGAIGSFYDHSRNLSVVIEISAPVSGRSRTFRRQQMEFYREFALELIESYR